VSTHTLETPAPATASAPIRLAARGITRRFGAVVANNAIDLSVRRGTVHAIVGGNGAGKSTLMKIFQGLDRPDEGTLLLDGKPVVLAGPADAFSRGIGMVHQEFMLVPGLTLLENLILAKEPAAILGRIDRKAALEAARRLEKEAGVSLDWDMLVDDAPVHVRQIVEILRLLYRGADVLILDEPTAVLAPAQIRDLIALIHKLKGEGRTILFISHKLDEVMQVADDITVLRAGRVVGSMPVSQTDKGRLAEMMIGEVLTHPTARPAAAGAPVLQIFGLAARDSRGIERIKGVDLTVRAGEIVAIAGVAGNGQDELAAAVAGLVAPAGGRIVLCGKDVTQLPIQERRALGLSYLSADRANEGLCPAAAIADNALAGHHRRPAFCRSGLLKAGAIKAHVTSLLDRYSVMRGSPADPVSSLSGGNQQRVAIARELDAEPKVLIACQPTRGVDIRGIAFIHQCLLDYRERGGAVLLITEELDEIIALADRILGLYGGRITGEIERGTAHLENIGRMMLGEALA